ncbi:uncharacterized protein TRIADDRAFT_60698 [Trichoplax adhaerens]|uniref:AB hydrolase-1 domain-containing protein n=1 Tax=Trichoplax adhaerens TaxID=10228 RepID=B3S949_TRIAD|nr:hypothetical protein TRIADDRAFT_60698 [Trichoplax adhaerens]EDV20736.1 hypothetical protein TRIADDRAFT_60698 [Trichoplax adhaerens]|eukprot:XP_002116677.1 hypothetical protein TRIADDRAFT_60698 [Trichoplax adhaerens]
MASKTIANMAGRVPISTFSKQKQVQHMIKKLTIFDAEMAYIDTGSGRGDPVVFFHGNPTSTYLWRNIIPIVSDQYRCLAPDLVGMGNSTKIVSEYRYADHYNYIEQWMDQVLPSGRVNIVCHDWGSGIAFNWCYRHPERVNSIVFMEALVGPSSWKGFPSISRKAFQRLRSKEGEKMVLDDNFFIEKLLPLSIMRKLSDEEMECYRRPFVQMGEARRPTLTFPREIPFREDGPADVFEIVVNYSKWLSKSTVPKLCILAEPGFFSKGIQKFTSAWNNQRFATVKGLHFLQEDSPEEIAQLILDFLPSFHSRL